MHLRYSCSCSHGLISPSLSDLNFLPFIEPSSWFGVAARDLIVVSFWIEGRRDSVYFSQSLSYRPHFISNHRVPSSAPRYLHHPQAHHKPSDRVIRELAHIPSHIWIEDRCHHHPPKTPYEAILFILSHTLYESSRALSSPQCLIPRG